MSLVLGRGLLGQEWSSSPGKEHLYATAVGVVGMSPHNAALSCLRPLQAALSPSTPVPSRPGGTAAPQLQGPFPQPLPRVAWPGLGALAGC